MKKEECPKCLSKDLGDFWVKGRMLQTNCRVCGWWDEPRTPEIKPISKTKKVYVNRFFGFEYELFDKYGHLLVHSATYHTQSEAKKELEKDIELHNKDIHVNPVTGILWPSFTEVKGEVFK